MAKQRYLIFNEVINGYFVHNLSMVWDLITWLSKTWSIYRN